MKIFRTLVTLPVALLMAACQSVPDRSMPLVRDLDLQRFMGDWYVIANIPTFLEKDAYNAVESYRLTPDGRVATTFRFRKGGFDGPVKVYHPTGFVSAADNAVWGMQFLWPIKAEFLVIYLDAAYDRTIIGRSRRDYVWLMARTPELSDTQYQEMLDAAAAAGYDVTRIQRVPQRWTDSGTD
jgi:apolipoprotein D and lipocalin family protein